MNWLDSLLEGTSGLLNNWFQYDVAKEQAQNGSQAENTTIPSAGTGNANSSNTTLLVAGGVVLVVLVVLMTRK